MFKKPMNNKTKTPLFHVSRRAALPWYKTWAIRGAALLLALRSFEEPQGPISYTFEAKTTDNVNRFKLVFEVK